MIYTSRYQERTAIIESGATPLRTTWGHPRFQLGYKLAAAIPELTPDRSWMGLPEDRYREMYVGQLEAVGRERISLTLGAFGGDVVLLCFDDVLGGEWCHRAMFADWWKAETGEDVIELTPGPEPVWQPSLYAVEKAQRILDGGRVREIDGRTWQVGGDSGLWRVTVNGGLPTACSCPSGRDNRKVLCSHRVAVYMTMERTKT